jgi:hypothetical protein
MRSQARTFQSEPRRVRARGVLHWQPMPGRVCGFARECVVAVLGVVILASACSSSSSDDDAVSVTLQAGKVPAGTGRLVGAEPVWWSDGPARHVLHADEGVLLAQSVRPNEEGAGPDEVLRSVDEGVMWERIDLPGPDGTGERVLWAEGGRAAVMALEAIKPFDEGGTPVIRTSDDAGATWHLAPVPDPNDAGRYIQYGRWWKGRWILYGNTEKGSGPAIYSAIWHSADGRNLSDPVILPGAVEQFRAAGLTVSGGALIATGENSGSTSQTWRSVDGTHWTLLGSDVRALSGGPLLRGDEISFDGGRTWKSTSSIPGEVGFSSASRTGGTWWFVQGVPTDEHTGVGRLVRTDDGGGHFRLVPLPPRPRACRTSAAADEVLEPPKEAGSSLVVLSTCTATGGTGGPIDRPEVQISVSRDDGRSWSSVPVPAAARYGVPVAFTAKADGASVLVQDWTSEGAESTTHLLILDHL